MCRKDIDMTLDQNRRQRDGQRRALITVGSWPMLIASLVMFGGSILVSQQVTVTTVQPQSIEQRITRTETVQYPPVLYGFVHMAKTAGTTVNGVLAARYERVCGNKGYSYDSFQTNLRFNNETSIRDQKDSISQIREDYNRGRLPLSIMNEIGYEDCDYVSAEEDWNDFWVERFSKWHLPLELHVPCREPIDHFMSQWNHRHRWPFRCHPPKHIDLLGEVDTSIKRVRNRFSMQLQKHDNIHLKCFDFSNTTQYLEYMGERLQDKRLKGDYVFRSTNSQRNKSEECIWQDSAVRKKVHAHLLDKYDYYKFCSKCLGSKDDLLVGK